jgi:hypothetical protein
LIFHIYSPVVDGTDARDAGHDGAFTPKMSQLMCVPVSSQIERSSDAFGSEEPRIHLRKAPSDLCIAAAVAVTLPYDAIVSRSRSDSPSILC